MSCMMAELHEYVSTVKRGVIVEDEPEYTLPRARYRTGDGQN
jgi:hypothetical protein